MKITAGALAAALLAPACASAQSYPAPQDPGKVARANRARSAAYMPALKLISGFDINWNIVSYATQAWARAVFPDEAPDVALARLWDAIFAASRIDTDDPVAAWRERARRRVG